MIGVCDHGMPTPASCWDCMEEGNLPIPPRVRPQIIARGSAVYAGGNCHLCDASIELEDAIALVTNGQKESWMHEFCAQDLVAGVSA